MKNKNKVPQNPAVSQDPAPAAPPLEQLNPEREDQLLPWQEEIVALAKARLSIDSNTKYEVVCDMHRRAIALCTMVEDLALGSHESEPSFKALASVMKIVQETIHVAAYINEGEIHFYDYN